MSELLVTIKCAFYVVLCLGQPRVYYRWKALGFRLLGALSLYERKHLKFLESRLTDGCVGIDIGAHFGVYSRLFIKKAGNSGQVVAVEPFPEGYQYLKKSFASLSQVTVSPCAISDTAGAKLFLNIPKLHGLVPEPALASVSDQPQAGAVAIETTTVDELAKNLSKLDIVKADIEGFERKFFLGAKATLKRLRPLVLFEDNNPAEHLDFYRDLERELGFVLHLLTDSGELLPVTNASPKDNNFYFVPQDGIGGEARPA